MSGSTTGSRDRAAVAQVWMHAFMSLDGSTARPDDSVGPLFLVPVVLGEGIRFFGDHGGAERLLGVPEVVQGDCGTRLRYEPR
jgi:hypothetical protein